ncbi:MAG: polysaccharide deacetylase, partial [Pseudomonadota bacterium]
PMCTTNGPVISIPHYNELNDMTLLATRSQSEEEWARQIIDAAEDHLLRYETEGAGAFAFTMTPYIAGQPFRIRAVEDILTALGEMADLKLTTARAIADQFGRVTP